jgi:hypothetical protein
LIAYKISKFHQVWDNTLYLGGLNLTVETDCHMYYWQTLVFFLKLFNVLVMEIGWTDVGSGGYILVSCAHSNTSCFCFFQFFKRLFHK